LAWKRPGVQFPTGPYRSVPPVFEHGLLVIGKNLMHFGKLCIKVLNVVLEFRVYRPSKKSNAV